MEGIPYSNYTVCSCLSNIPIMFKPFRYANLTEEEFESTLHLEAEESFQLP